MGIGKNSDYLILLSGEPKEKLMSFRANRNGNGR